MDPVFFQGTYRGVHQKGWGWRYGVQQPLKKQGQIGKENKGMKTTGIWGLFSVRLVCFSQHQKGFYVGKKKKKDFPFPREFGRKTCMHGGSNFPLKSYSLPQSHSSLLTEDLVIAEPQFKSECDCDQTQRLSLLFSLLRQNRSQ